MKNAEVFRQHMLWFSAHFRVLKWVGKVELPVELFSFLYSDIMMRDNLFEIVTTSRTFYVQVISFKLWVKQIDVVKAKKQCHLS